MAEDRPVDNNTIRGDDFTDASRRNGENHFPERPSSSMSISSQRENLGSEGMSSMIGAHMKEILQPFAENVEEIHKMVFSLTDSVRDLQRRMEGNAADIASQGTLIASLRIDHDHTSIQSRSTQDSLANCISEKATLEGRVENLQKLSKQTLDKLDSCHSLTQRSIEDLQKSLEKTNTKAQKVEKEFRQGIAQCSETIGHISVQLNALEQTHDKTAVTQKVNRLAYDNHVIEFETLSEQQKEHRTVLDNFEKANLKHFGEIEEKIVQGSNQVIQVRQDAQKALNDASHKLTARLDADEKAIDKAAEKLNQQEQSLTTQQRLLLANGEHVSKLIKCSEQRSLVDIQACRMEVQATGVEASKQSRHLAEMQNNLKQLSKPDKDGKVTLHYFLDDIQMGLRMGARIESIMGLPALSKDPADDEGHTFKGGVLLSPQQIKDFQATFNKFDSDGSGQISTLEIGAVMKSLGHELDMEIIKTIVADIDHDGSGEICFDEFCSMMAKILGPDGKVDVDGYLGRQTEIAKREANQSAMVEAFPIVKAEVDKLGPRLDEETTKLVKTGERVQSLEADYASMIAEVQKLKQGLQSNNEYWKGLSNGLKETKKHVALEGEGSMLPRAAKLRNLPPLSERPFTAR